MGKKTADSERKRKIEEIRRKERASERRKTVLVVTLSTVLGLSLVGLAVWAERSGNGGGGGDNKELTAIGASAADANCAEEESAPTPPAGNDHRNGTISYDVVPPMGGPHSGQTLRALKKFYTRDDNPAPEQAVHNQEHGLVIAWYDNKLPEDQVKLLEDATAAIPDRFMAVPWTRSDFKDDRHFVLTSWGHMRRCGKVSGEVIEEFFNKYKDHKDAPERGAGT